MTWSARLIDHWRGLWLAAATGCARWVCLGLQWAAIVMAISALASLAWVGVHPIAALSSFTLGAAGSWLLWRLAIFLADIASTAYVQLRHLRDHWRAWRDRRGFFLYLRSFSDFATGTTATRQPMPPRTGGGVVTSYLNFSQVLAQALARHGAVVFISHEPLDLTADHGLVVDSTDANWRERFGLCAEHARAIIVAPYDTPGSIEELRRLLVPPFEAKTLLVMRPADPGGQRVSQWNAASAKLADGGLTLPDYDPRGALAVAVGSRWMIVPFEPSRSEAAAIRLAFERLIGQLGSGQLSNGTPLRQMLATLPLRSRLGNWERRIKSPPGS